MSRAAHKHSVKQDVSYQRRRTLAYSWNVGSVQTHRLVINGEVVVQLDDTLSLGLELPVGLLSPPLFQVAVAVILAP